MVGIPSVASLKSLVGIDARIKVVDVGSKPIDGTPTYAPLLRDGIADVVGFDPDLETTAGSEATRSAHQTYLPYAVGDGRRHTLHRCFNPGMSSLLRPNRDVLRLFHGFSGWGTVVSTSEVETKRLDDLAETKGVDLLKLDIQGAELMALESATERLRDALVVQAEVEFLPMYVDQPLFGDVAAFLQRHGFQFHRFHPLVNRVIVPLVLHDDLHAGLSQSLWADAVFVRDLTRLDALSARQLRALATIMHDCYGSLDLVMHLLRALDQREGTTLAADYIPRLMAYPRLVDWIVQGQPVVHERVPFPKGGGHPPEAAPSAAVAVTPASSSPSSSSSSPPAPAAAATPVATSASKPRKTPARSPRKAARSGR